MNKLYRAFLASRVARRVFVLFVASALVPLALMALLSMTYVRDTLLEQGQQRLAANAKAYGSAILGRLLDAADRIQHEGAWGVAPTGVGYSPQLFRSITVVPTSVRSIRLPGRASDIVLTGTEHASLDHGRPLLRMETNGDADPTVAMIVPLGSSESRRWAVAEIRGDYLWGDRAWWPAAVEFCVVDGTSRLPVYCPAAWPRDTVRRIGGESSRLAAASIAWDDAGTPMRAALWPQPLGAEFGAGDWLVVASQPEADLLAPAAAFRSLFLPAAVLALAVVIWLSLRLIRSTLAPLESLTQATRRVIAHDFDSRVETTRDDEFGELAQAFNSMTGRIGQQFKTLNTMAEIDRAILSSRDVEQVVPTVLRHMCTLIPANAVGVMLLDHDNRLLARASFVRSDRPDDVKTIRGAITGDEYRKLGAAAGGEWITAASRYPRLVKAVLAKDVGAAYAYPIVWRDALCGVVAFGFAKAMPFSAEEQTQVQEAAARLGVAISSAWRDAQLYKQAHYDSLTGLPNRLLLVDRLSQEIVRCQRESTRCALLFIDLDHFKKVNDTQGHSSGDAVLVETARRLAQCVRACDTIARLGGDEFTITFTQLSNPGEVHRGVKEVLAALAQPFDIDGQQTYLGASIGIAVFPEDGKTAADLLKSADTAMYRAKASGRGQAMFFEERMNHEVRERVLLERELHAALDNDEFTLCYQPQMDLRTGRIVGAEALLRWRHPTRGLVSPSRFIPVAEDSGLIEHIGRWVILDVCRQWRAFQARGVALERLSANVSVRQLYKPDFAQHVQESMRRFEIAPASLELEVTESLIADRVVEVRGALNALKALGVSIALDDFGTGFASLAYLMEFPVDVVKIDRTFVSGLPSGEHSLAIVTAMIAMSHALGKKVVAEGVETETQLTLLRNLGCDYAQGHLLSKPIPAEEFEQFMLVAGQRRQVRATDEPAVSVQEAAADAGAVVRPFGRDIPDRKKWQRG
jgi:diguanylate cyclase (GGDEF)-like protein